MSDAKTGTSSSAGATQEEVEFVARGAVAELFELVSEACEKGYLAKPHEALLEGPAGTGKTRGALEFANWWCEEFPGSRVLLTRATRTSMNESVLQLLEDFVFGADHRILRERPMTRNHRDNYEYPWARLTGLDGVTRTGRSRLVITGLDNPDRVMSTEYDLAIIFEATECGLDGLEKVNSRLRARNAPCTLLVCDCNPGPRSHMLNRRAMRGFMRRLLSRHQDNPVYYDAVKKEWTPFWKEVYGPKLEALTGHNRKRLLDGLWVSAEGLVIEEYNPAIHLLQGGLVRDKFGTLQRGGSGCPKLRVENWDQEIEMKWFFGSQDWGYRKPGSLSIWGVDDEDRMFQVYQAYHTNRQIQWWAKVASDIHRELNLTAIVCDADDDNISIYNEHMRKSDGSGIARKAQKGKHSWEVGCDMLRWALTGRHTPTMLDTQQQGVLPPFYPRIYFVENNLVPHPDPELVEKGLPLGTAEELESLVWKEISNPDKQRAKEESDPSCEDHGFDECRYAITWKWKRGNPTKRQTTPKFKKGTLGDMLGHADVYQKTRLGEY